MPSFIDDMLRQVPKEISATTKVLQSENIALLWANSYVGERELSSSEYVFALTSSAPPPTDIGGKIYHFKAKKLVAFPLDYSITLTRSMPSDPYPVLYIKRNFFDTIAENVAGKCGLISQSIETTYSQKLINLIHSYENEIIHYGNSCSLMIKSISNQLIVQLLRDLHLDCRQPIHTQKHYIDIAKDYLTVYYQSNICLEDLCRYIHISPYHLIRTFKARTGKTPHEYLTEIRLNHAEELLIKKRLRIEEIAKYCGFLSSSHFSSIFKHRRGMTPTDFRKKSEIPSKY